MLRREAEYQENIENAFYSIHLCSILGTSEKQEDVLGCYVGDIGAVLVLCDGMGGMEEGREAAEKAAETILSLAEQENWMETPNAFLRKAIEIADEEVYFLKNKKGEKSRCGTTVIIALVIGRKVYYANVGDSRIYYYGGSSLVQLSKDHNYGEFLKAKLEAGEVTPEIVEKEWSKASGLTGFLGLGAIRECYIAEEPLLLDRNQVLCLESDGLYRLLKDSETEEIIGRNLKDLQQASDQLLFRAEENRKSYQDNTSYILFRLK